MIGYPMAFLAKLFQATGDVAHLEAARDYLDFALSCGGNLRTFYFSHKVAWGDAALARITGDQHCVELATQIVGEVADAQVGHVGHKAARRLLSGQREPSDGADDTCRRRSRELPQRRVFVLENCKTPSSSSPSVGWRHSCVWHLHSPV